MAIELDKEARKEAIASIERWFQDERDERVGNIFAGALLGFFLEEIAPTVYNRAVADVQDRLRMRVDDLEIEVHEDEFGYWRKSEKEKQRRK